MTQSRKSEAIVFTEPGRCEVQQVRLPEIGEDEILVKTRYTMVSSGTELRVFAGHYGSEGKFPLVPGYSSVGEIIEKGSAVRDYEIGDLVSCRNPVNLPETNVQWGGQCAYQVQRTKGEDRVIPLPQGVDPKDYVVAETAAISYRGMKAAAPVDGETVVVVGQGMIGAYSAYLFHLMGCKVIAVDLEESRLQRARDWGAYAALNAGDEQVADKIMAMTEGGGDIVVESSGSTPGAKLAYSLLRRKPQSYSEEYKVEPIEYYHNQWPRLVMQANYLKEIPLDPFNYFPGEGVTVLTPMDRGVQDRLGVVELIRRGRFDPAHFTQNIDDFHAAPDAYRRLDADKAGQFSQIFTW